MTDATLTLSARLHDGTILPVTATGRGPAVLLPVRTEPHDEATARSMRAWGADPDLGATLAQGMSSRYRVVTADYEGHRLRHPAPLTLTPDNLVSDLLAVADAAGARTFAYYGYSWLALSGLQLALRTDRLWALAMGGFPPAGGPYRAMLDVTRAAHTMATTPGPKASSAATTAAEPGDWDAAGMGADADATRQFVTLYEALEGFDDDAAQQTLTVPRLAFAGEQDTIAYGPAWGGTVVRIAEPLAEHRARLRAQGWTVEILPALDHMGAMHAGTVLPLLRGWLDAQASGHPER